MNTGSKTDTLTGRLLLSTKARRKVTLCNHNYTHEGVYHPDRIMDEYDLLYMQKGEWDIFEDACCHHLVPGQVLLLSPGLHHYSRTKCSPEMRNVYVHFTACPEDRTFYSSDPVTNLPADTLLLSKRTDCASHPSVLNIIEKIVEIYWSDSIPNRDFRLSTQLDCLLTELSDLHHAQNSRADVLISEILHRFQCNPEKFFSPYELAVDYGISLRSMSGRFKKVTGMSIHQYQLKLKLDMAYNALPQSPGRGLRDIAHSYGFYDEFQFSKLFKRQFGVAPSTRRSPK